MNDLFRTIYTSHWHLNPFSTPRTMAGKWDLSEMLSPSNRVRTPRTAVESQAAEAKAEAASPEQDDWPGFEPFPETRTFPSGWDVSSLLKE